MRSVRFLSHTADIRVLVSGTSVEELFQAGLEALEQLLKPGACVGLPEELPVREVLELSAPDQTALLVDFLSDVLTACHRRKAIFCELQVIDLEERYVKGVLLGKEVDAFSEDIKAVTYHEAEVVRTEEGTWEGKLIFDI